MPIYEFQCEECGHKFDILQKMSDPNPSCPAVGIRVLRPFQYDGFQLKPGFSAGASRVLPTHVPAGCCTVPLYDVSHFFNDAGEPLSAGGFHESQGFSDTETGEALTSLVGYVERRCGSPTFKLMSRGSFQLKGGGWYKDGYS